MSANGGPVANAIIAGVNKAGTTSLFVTLGQHPDIAPASVKETKYFLPTRWGQPLDPRAVYETYWDHAGAAPVRLEATPAYFSGGRALVAKVREVCGAPKIVVVLREPVGRLLSYSAFQQALLRIPDTTTLDEYLAAADARSVDDFRDVFSLVVRPIVRRCRLERCAPGFARLRLDGLGGRFDINNGLM